MKITKNEFLTGNRSHVVRNPSHLFKPRAKTNWGTDNEKKGRPKATLLNVMLTNDQFVHVPPKKLKKPSKSAVATAPSPSKSPGQSLPPVPSNVQDPSSVLAMGL